MNIFWDGAFLGGAVSILIFYVAFFRPEFLKSIHTGRDKYHMSPLGAVSCGIALFALGFAGMLNGLHMLSGVYVLSVLILAGGEVLAVAFYDSHRKSRLGSASSFYVGPQDDKNYDKKLLAWLLFLLVTSFSLAILFPTLKRGAIELLAAFVIVLPVAMMGLVKNWRLKRALKKYDITKRKNRGGASRNDKNDQDAA
jgi:hypothetical protein